MANYGEVFDVLASTFDFMEWAAKAKLSDETVDKLKATNIITFEALTEIELADLKELKLQPGDRLLMRREIKHLKAELADASRAADKQKADASRAADKQKPGEDGAVETSPPEKSDKSDQDKLEKTDQEKGKGKKKGNSKKKVETESDLTSTSSGEYSGETSGSTLSSTSSKKHRSKRRTTQRPTTRLLAKDKGLQNLLAGLTDVGIKDILAIQD